MFIRKDLVAVQSGCNIKNPLVSIVVPIYKSEKYLEDCIQSILGQTYQNLEIFLVDDGSPDGCGKICDEYAAKDSRIFVIHKSNGGLSSARNAALAKMNGDYVAFVDGDDEIAPDMITYLLGAVQRYEAQIAVCGFTKCYIDGRKELDCAFSEETVYVDTEVLVQFLPDEYIGSQACNKLFAAQVFKDIQFPHGRVYEDIAIMHCVFARANKIVCLPEGKYYYKIRDDSTSFTQNARWAYGLFRAFADRYEFALVNQNEYSIQQSIIDFLLAKACGFAIAGMRFWKGKEKLNNEYKIDAIKFLKKNKKFWSKSKKITRKRKVKATLIIAFPKLYSIFLKKG